MEVSMEGHDGKEEAMREKKQKRQIIVLCILAIAIVIALVGIFIGKLAGSSEKSGDLHSEAGSQSTESKSTECQSPLQAESLSPGKTENSTDQENQDSRNNQNSPNSQNNQENQDSQDSNEGQSMAPDSIYSSYALLIRLSDHAILLDKGGEDRIYPASMTKIMTALVAIEALPDLDEKIQLTAEQINPLYLEGASLAGFSAGETVTVRDLLYGVMLPSGAEACVALADRIAGSEANFVALMNQKAQELGLTNTHFVTDSGLHDDNHYTTCGELASLLEYALSNETFRTIFTAHSYTCTPTEEHPEGLYLASTLFQKLETDTLENGAVIEGGKTGYTEEAQLCLASLASFQGQEYILVTAHAEGNHYTEQFNITDACSIYGQLGK